MSITIIPAVRYWYQAMMLMFNWSNKRSQDKGMEIWSTLSWQQEPSKSLLRLTVMTNFYKLNFISIIKCGIVESRQYISIISPEMILRWRDFVLPFITRSISETWVDQPARWRSRHSEEAINSARSSPSTSGRRFLNHEHTSIITMIFKVAGGGPDAHVLVWPCEQRVNRVCASSWQLRRKHAAHICVWEKDCIKVDRCDGRGGINRILRQPASP